MKFNKIHFFGKPLSTAVLHTQRVRKLKALPILAADALSSVAYGTEEILRVLILAGIAVLTLSIPIALAICGLIAILGASYWQTIHAYPGGGGAFTVARENLGVIPGLLAAAALLIDYLLTVAVSVSAGIRAVTSAFPALMPETILLCLATVIFITWINLRGVRESATVFAFPTYAFIGLVLLLIGIGIWEMTTGQIKSIPIHIHPAAYDQTMAAVTVLLVLRAFSAGCSALTGIECIANGVPAFEVPEVKNASQALIMMVVLLGIMFFGITYLANVLHIVPQESESVLSALAHAILGNGVLYYALQSATTLILLLAANTAFAGFPRLASILSDNKFLPKQLSNLGDRLSFSNGIFLLSLLSCFLIVLFRGDTHALIPLYSVGVFMAFSLSQLGMVRRWTRMKTPYWYWKASLNLLGFIATAIATFVIIESKFTKGAWIIVVIIPIALLIFTKIHRHYTLVEHELSVTDEEAREYLDKLKGVEPKVVVPVSKIHRGTLAALQFARTISSDVTAVAIDINPEQIEKVQKMWSELNLQMPLVILPSPYRETIGPLKRFIKSEDRRDPERGLCMIVLPEAIPTRWWHYFLHNQRATLLKAALYYNKKHKGSTRVFVGVPYQLKR